MIANALDFSDVPVGDKSDIGFLVEPVVVILHYHDMVSGADGLFPEEDAVSDILVVLVGAFVGLGNDAALFGMLAVLGGEELFEVEAGEPEKIGFRGNSEEWEVGLLPGFEVGYLVAEDGGVEEYVGDVVLSDDLSELEGRGLQRRNHREVFFIESGTFFGADGRELGGVS